MPNAHILVLDDNQALCNETAQTLIDAGYAAQSATTIAQALALARAQSFDVALVDIYLADANGIAFFTALREITPEIAGIAMTGFSSWQVAMDALRAGFAGFLVKPFPAEQLIAAVAAALEQETLRRDNARLRALVPLYELSRSFMGATELSETLHQVVTTVRQETRAEIASLMLLDEANAELTVAAADGLPPEFVETQRRQVGKSIAGMVAERGEAVIIADDQPLDSQMRASLEKPELGSALSLPLRVRGEVIGVLNLSRLRGVAPFTQADLELATVLASQAAVALDQARLIDVMRNMSETSQRLAGAFDLDDAAATTLEAVLTLSGAKRAALWLVEDLSNQLTLYKTIGFAPDQERQLKPPPFVTPADDANLRERQALNLLWLPILRGDRKFGLVEIHLPSGKTLRADRMGVLRTVAHTAAAVIESHRLRAREAIAFREIDATLRGESNLQLVLERLMRQVAEACGAQNGAIFIKQNDGAPSVWVELGSGAPAQVAQEAIAANHPILHSLADSMEQGVGSVIAAPLTVGTRVEGAIVLTHRDPRMFGPRHLNLLSVLSSSAALIVRNAQLYAWSEEKVISEERARIAREIHDGLAQDINFMLMRVQTLQTAQQMGKAIDLPKELEQLNQTLRRDVREVRQTIFALRPVEIETMGFVPALEKFVTDFAAANDFRIQLNVQGDATWLAPKLQSALYRLVQEALNNVRKHARATNVWIDLKFHADVAALTVRDDGTGFDMIKALDAARGRGSVGILQMRERAERAGGAFEIETAEGQGTTVRVTLPL
ncbi:GAF domain-containing protein [Anaerolineae bacterium CFX7]|nr:GAF domain-containing protein [Anaerolineae bacterium CFX7]